MAQAPFKPKTNIFTREATLTPSDSDRSVELSFSSEDPVTRYDWDGNEYAEILSHKDGAVDLTRLQNVGTVLFNHDRYRLPVAKIDRVWIDSATKRGKATITFDTDDESDKIYQKIKSGSLRGVSVGYEIKDSLFVAEGTTTDGIEGPALIATKWMPYEISVVTLPADATVGIGRSLETKNITQEDQKKMEKKDNVKIEEKKTESAPAPAVDTEKLMAERERVISINDVCRAFGIDPDEYIKNGTSIADVNADIVKAQRAKMKPLTPPAPAVHVEKEDTDKFRAAAVDGLRMRLGFKVDKPAAGAEEFRGAHLIDLARETLERKGEKISSGMRHMDIASRALSYGSDDFKAILGSVTSAVLHDSYIEAPATWRSWCGITSLSDFKQTSVVRLSEASNLELIPEGGEYSMADMSDASAGIRVYTYGRKFALTREAIINDDLSAFSRLTRKFGDSAARTVNHMVYALLASNPSMDEDSKKLFNTSHKNLASTGAVISTAAIAAARAAMRRQKMIGGTATLNVSPAYLIVPPELEAAAGKMLNSDTDPSAVAAGITNVFKNTMRLIVDSELTDATAWYCAASPAAVDTVTVAFLDGVDSPYIEQRESWDTDGIEYKVRLDFGVKCLDYRGLYKNPGAAE